MNWRQVVLGPLALALFLALFVFMMNKISAPDARFELGDFVIIADLVLALVLLAALVQRVHFSLVPGQRIVPDPVHHLTLRPTGAVNLNVQQRD